MSRIAVPIVSLFLISFFILAGSATTVTIGDIFSESEVTTSLMINDVTDLATASVKITFEPSVILITSAKKGDLPSFIANVERADEGWVKIGACTTGDSLSGNVKLADLTIAPTGNYGEISDLTLTVETLSDSGFKTIDADVIDGFFYIGMNGDVTVDRIVDIADSEYIAKGIAGIAGYELKEGASDVNGDGIVDAYDCVYLARHAAGISGYEELK
ncbi:MAG TPA: dockerin type I domain-containing protein [Desulfobacteria bacterium]|nr:dockerin type I domain-containing protein [Desulfobacteria bacterium]